MQMDLFADIFEWNHYDKAIDKALANKWRS